MTNRRSKQATLKAQAVEALGQRMLALESRGSLPRLICEARLVLQEALAPKALVQDLQDYCSPGPMEQDLQDCCSPGPMEQDLLLCSNPGPLVVVQLLPTGQPAAMACPPRRTRCRGHRRTGEGCWCVGWRSGLLACGARLPSNSYRDYKPSSYLS